MSLRIFQIQPQRFIIAQAVHRGIAEELARVYQLGGGVEADGQVWMTGDAVMDFEGMIRI
ncbi:MAG: hypothetical protein ACI4ME_09900 [Aristaeellaceae bacterium]